MFHEEIIVKTLKEFSETKGANIKHYDLFETIDSPQKPKEKSKDNKYNLDDTNLTLGSTIVSHELIEDTNLYQKVNFIRKYKKECS